MDRRAAGGGHDGLLNVVDLEATCWDGRPPPGAVSEIIETGLAVVDLDARERVGRHRVPVRPARSRGGAFRTEPTGFTQAEADRVTYPFGRQAPPIADAAWGTPWFPGVLLVRQRVKLLNRNKHGATHGNPCPVTVP